MAAELTAFPYKVAISTAVKTPATTISVLIVVENDALAKLNRPLIMYSSQINR